MQIRCVNPEGLHQAGSGVVIDVNTSHIIGCYFTNCDDPTRVDEDKTRREDYQRLLREVDSLCSGAPQRNLDLLMRLPDSRWHFVTDPRPVRIVLHVDPDTTNYSPVFEIDGIMAGQRLGQWAAPLYLLEDRLLGRAKTNRDVIMELDVRRTSPMGGKGEHRPHNTPKDKFYEVQDIIKSPTTDPFQEEAEKALLRVLGLVRLPSTSNDDLYEDPGIRPPTTGPREETVNTPPEVPALLYSPDTSEDSFQLVDDVAQSPEIKPPQTDLGKTSGTSGTTGDQGGKQRSEQEVDQGGDHGGDSTEGIDGDEWVFLHLGQQDGDQAGGNKCRIM